VNSDPSASAWDVPNRRCVAKLARNSHPVHHVTFFPDDSAIVGSCGGWQSGRLTIVPLGSGDPRAIAWPLNLKMAEVHPSGRSVVVIDERNRLSVLDLLSGQIECTLFVGGVRIPAEALILLGNDYPRDWFTMPLDAIEDLLHRGGTEVAEEHRRIVRNRPTEGTDSTERESPSLSVELGREMIKAVGSPARIGKIEREVREALAATREPGWLEQKARSREWVHQLAFDPAGERLFAATERGLRVYLWRECVAARVEMPPPILVADADTIVFETADGFLNIGGAVSAFVHDPDRDWLLFGGADGRVRYLDLATGQTGILLEPPGLRPIQQLAFSRDRTALGVACGTDMIEDGSARPMRSTAAVQFWDYRACCDRVGESTQGNRRERSDR
jgi:hypothetical protein